MTALESHSCFLDGEWKIFQQLVPKNLRFKIELFLEVLFQFSFIVIFRFLVWEINEFYTLKNSRDKMKG